MSLRDHKSVVRDFYDQWNSGAIDFDRLVHADVTNHQPEREPEPRTRSQRWRAQT
jgi:hypothetical protein